MAKGSGEKNPKKNGVTAAGMVEAIEQDVELSIEQAKDLAHEAVEAVEKKLGVRKPGVRIAKKASSKAIKSSKPAETSKPSSEGRKRKR